MNINTATDRCTCHDTNTHTQSWLTNTSTTQTLHTHCDTAIHYTHPHTKSAHWYTWPADALCTLMSVTKPPSPPYPHSPCYTHTNHHTHKAKDIERNKKSLYWFEKGKFWRLLSKAGIKKKLWWRAKERIQDLCREIYPWSKYCLKR